MPLPILPTPLDHTDIGKSFTITACAFINGVATLKYLVSFVPSNQSFRLRMTFAVRDLGDEALTTSVAEAFVEGIASQTVEDVPIWENKAYVVKPALSDADGPIMKFRKWASQFYAEDYDLSKALHRARVLLGAPVRVQCPRRAATC